MSKREDRTSLKDMLSHADEAVVLLGGTGREGSPEVPWPQTIGMRNRLVHGYDVVDNELLWDTVAVDLPPLIATLRHVIHEAELG